MRAGELRHRIELQRREDARDAVGQAQPAWSTFATVWASYRPLSGGEAINMQIAQSEMSCTFRIRYRSDVTPRDRVKWGERLFDINAAADILGLGEALELQCREKV